MGHDDTGSRQEQWFEEQGYSTDPGAGRDLPIRYAPGRVTAPGSGHTLSYPDGDSTEPLTDASDLPQIILVIAYDQVLSFSFPLFHSGDWLPMGRGLTDSLTVPMLRIPNRLTVLPRGPILEVRYQLGAVFVRRTTARRDCTVSVDEIRLRPDAQVSLHAEGSIDYTLNNAPRSRLTYRLVQTDKRT